MILKTDNNLMMNLILKQEHIQDKVDLVKSEDAKVIFQKLNMQLKLCKIFKVVQILMKLKLYNKLRIKIIKIQLNIMIVDIDKKNKAFQFMNILQ